MSFLKDKVVVITGGSEGIGRALVEIALNNGAKVATCSRRYDKLYQLQKLFPGKPLHIMVTDVSKESECKTFIESTIKYFGKIDILINNAGISMRALVVDSEISAFEKVMNINFWGTVYCTKFALPSIIQNKGTVAGVSSIVGYRGTPGRSAYSASKFAMQGFLEALRVEMMLHDVNVLWVSPGFTTTGIRSAALNAEGKSIGETPMDESKLMSAEVCAQHIMRAIEKRKRSMVLTLLGKATVAVNKFFPSIVDYYSKRFFFKNDELIK